MKTLKEIKEDFKETGALEVGEEGDMVCFAKTKRGAWIKFRRTVRAYCGDGDEVDSIKIEDIGVAFLHRITDANRGELVGSPIEHDEDWYVSTHERKGDVEVWYYSTY